MSFRAIHFHLEIHFDVIFSSWTKKSYMAQVSTYDAGSLLQGVFINPAFIEPFGLTLIEVRVSTLSEEYMLNVNFYKIRHKILC